ncbi:hypothetical protein G4B88_005902 [Cannabis sativa]|uniref:Uncharacterized protein n=1 Tax=Cannabis sativa TaxID=3483 RepID=A0A7J6IB47_CANSA|nr:hypothetical protein G4B88_005902 [Cannabis sativa]
MVTLLVATSIDPTSINPANALLAMPGWQPLPSLQGSSIIREDHLEKRWEDATGEVVNEVIFFCKHTAVSNRPALTPGWAAPPNPRIGPWLRLLKRIAESHNLVPEFVVIVLFKFKGEALFQTHENLEHLAMMERAEHVIREEKTLTTYNFIEVYCELIAARL